MKKFVALILLFSMLLISACGNADGVVDDPNAKPIVDNSDTVVMTYEGYTLTSGVYAFIFSALKTNYLYLLQLYGETDFVEDTETFWNIKTENGESFGDAVTADIYDHCKMLLICKKMSAEYNVTLDAEALETVSDEYNDYISAYGGERELDVYLNRYGISGNELMQYLKDKQMINVLQNKLCAKGGLCEVKDSDVYALINEQYCKAKHIYLTDEKNNNDALSKANEILAQIKSGEKKYDDFASLSEDNSTKDYPDGFLVNIKETEERYSNLLASLKVGEAGVCEADDGAYVVMKVEITDEDRDTRFDSAWQEIADKQFSDVLDSRYDLVELNNEELGKYDIITADVLQ